MFLLMIIKLTGPLPRICAKTENAKLRAARLNDPEIEPSLPDQMAYASATRSPGVSLGKPLLSLS